MYVVWLLLQATVVSIVVYPFICVTVQVIAIQADPYL